MSGNTIDGMDKTWAVVFNAFVLILLMWPGVWYIGCVYAVTAQILLVTSVLLEYTDVIPVAARVSSFAAVANTILAIVEWKSISNVLYLLSAAIHAAVIAAVSVATIVDSEKLHNRF